MLSNDDHKNSRLIEDDGLRARIGQRGRGTVLDKCSLSANATKLLAVFTRLHT